MLTEIVDLSGICMTIEEYAIRSLVMGLGYGEKAEE